MACANPATTESLFENNVHPRLLFGPDDIPALRRKAGQLEGGRYLKEILRRCEKYATRGDEDYVDPTALRDMLPLKAQAWHDLWYHKIADAMHCLAFGYAFTGDGRWVRPAIDLMLAIADLGLAASGFSLRTIIGQLPIAYDILQPHMAAADAAKVEAHLRQRVVDIAKKYPVGAINNLGTNCVIPDVHSSALALGAVYRPQDDRDALLAVAAFARRTIHLAIDEGGAIYEGPSYGAFDSEFLAVAAEVLRRSGAADLWKTESRFANMCRHWAYLLLPGEQGVNAITDSGQAPLPIWAALLSARRLNDPALQWVFERTAVSHRDAAKIHSPGYAVLWSDPQAAAADPGKAGWPTARCSGGWGLVTSRTGWGDDDMYFSLTASGRTPGCEIHQQVDGGHFSLFALGEAFSVDSGYGDTDGQYHSLMRPGGREPSRGSNGWGHMPYGGRVRSFAAGRGADYACVDVGEQWEYRQAFRHALCIRAPQASPYVVLVDCYDPGYNVKGKDMAMGFSDHLLYEWLMQTQPGNRIELDDDAGRATVYGRRHRMEAAFSYPDKEHYPFAPRVELQQDTIDSYPFAMRTQDNDHFGTGQPPRQRPRGGGRCGMGVRPRLKANLWAYSGQLMAALLPRRDNEPAVGANRITAVGHFGLTLDFGDVTDTVIVAPIDRWLDLAGIRGEATLAVVRRNTAGGKVLWWAAADVFSLAIDATQVVPVRPEPATLVEPR